MLMAICRLPEHAKDVSDSSQPTTKYDWDLFQDGTEGVLQLALSLYNNSNNNTPYSLTPRISSNNGGHAQFDETSKLSGMSAAKQRDKLKDSSVQPVSGHKRVSKTSMRYISRILIIHDGIGMLDLDTRR